MGFRFRNSIKILPGLRLNLSKRGISATVGVRGASVNVGSKGTFLNVGVPGTGVSYRDRIGTTDGEAQAALAPDTQQPVNSSFPLMRVLALLAILALVAIVVGSK